MDSLRTTNLSGETTRILAGSYTDPVFGSSQAHSIFQYKPGSAGTVIADNATYDSAVLQLRFDFYTYGSIGKTTQSFEVYELTDELDHANDYFFNSVVNNTRTPIGSSSFDVDYDFFKQEFEDTDKDSVMTLNIKLDGSFGKRLFEAVDPEDVNYTDFEIFKSNFKGLAVVPQQTDKIVGFNPNDLNSVLLLYYTEDGTQKSLGFYLSQGVTFSQIISDRSTSELSGLTQYFTDFDPGPKRYTQSGSSIVTKLDISKFYDYVDTLTNVIINSAEFEITDVESSSTLAAPEGLAIGMLKTNNRFRTLATAEDTTDFVSFGGLLTLNDKSKFFIAAGQSTILSLDYSATSNSYNGYPTLFFQRLFELKSKRYPYWAIRPITPQPGKSLNRAIFPNDKIKLKIYYTRATLENQ